MTHCRYMWLIHGPKSLISSVLLYCSWCLCVAWCKMNDWIISIPFNELQQKFVCFFLVNFAWKSAPSTIGMLSWQSWALLKWTRKVKIEEPIIWVASSNCTVMNYLLPHQHHYHKMTDYFKKRWQIKTLSFIMFLVSIHGLNDEICQLLQRFTFFTKMRSLINQHWLNVPYLSVT